jgi:hypothetical protein
MKDCVVMTFEEIQLGSSLYLRKVKEVEGKLNK